MCVCTLAKKNFHLVRRTHTYFILHSDPRSGPTPSVWVISQKKQKKKTTNDIFMSAPKWRPASSSVKHDSQLAAGLGVKAGAGLRWETVVGQYQGHQVSVLNADYWTHRPHSKMVVLVRFGPAVLQVGRWNMKLDRHRCIKRGQGSQQLSAQLISFWNSWIPEPNTEWISTWSSVLR